MRSFRRDQSAQALLEIAFLLPMLSVLVLGTVDYSRAIYDEQVMTNLAGKAPAWPHAEPALPPPLLRCWPTPT